jgi:adenylosuccinate synthase
MKADVIVDLQYGDCGKGKVAHHLARTRNYTHVLRYNGGCNAGHTIYHNGKKFITHHVPCGVFFGIKSIIGSGCVVNPQQLLKEIRELEEGGVDTKGLIFVAKNAHVITQDHLDEESAEKKIGTTKRGNGPAYRDKYARTGIRAKDCAELEPFLIDLLPELNQPENYVLCEGAQGFGLDIDWGDYPFVTSSHCTTAGALLNGIPPKALNEVWGVMKCYETYVGAKKFELNNPVFSKIRTIGKEYGATTGRPRQVSWTDMNLVSNAILVNGVTHVVVNKMDVLDEVGTWNVFDQDGQVNILNDQEGFQNYFLNFLKDEFPTEGINTHFSSSPEMI